MGYIMDNSAPIGFRSLDELVGCNLISGTRFDNAAPVYGYVRIILKMTIVDSSRVHDYLSCVNDFYKLR